MSFLHGLAVQKAYVLSAPNVPERPVPPESRSATSSSEMIGGMPGW